MVENEVKEQMRNFGIKDECCGKYMTNCGRLFWDLCWHKFHNFRERAGWSGCLWNRFPKTCGSWEPAWSVTKCWFLALSLYCHTKAIGGLDCSTLQVCSLIKSFDQFESDGCDNCETVLHLKNNRWKKKQRSSDIVNYFQGTTSTTALVPTSTGWSPAASQRIAGSQGQLTGAFCYHSFADLIYFPGGRGSANLARYKTAH